MSDPSEPTSVAAATALLDRLVDTMIRCQIYFPEHPRVTDSVESLRRGLRDASAVSSPDRVRFSLMESYLVFDEHPLLGASLSSARLIRALRAWGAGGLELDPRASAEDVLGLLEVLRTKPEGEGGSDRANELLASWGCDGVQLLPKFHREGNGGREPGRGPGLYLPVELYQGLIELLQDVSLSVHRKRPFPFASVYGQAEQVLERLDAEEGEVLSLTQHEQYDAYTFGHSVRVSVLALNFARSLTRDRGILLSLGAAALLHDVGKSLVPLEVLHSKMRLTEEGRRELDRHPAHGVRILLEQKEAEPMAVAVAFGHHMAETRSGYPLTLHAHRLSTATRIVKICDNYEALTATRPYKQPMSPVDAYHVMLSMEGHFELGLLRRFIQVNGIFPSGSLVELSTGERAQVIRQTEKLWAPAVRPLTDREGVLLDEEDRRTVDLSSPLVQVLPTVRRALPSTL